jgi:endonuclease/exonuclease/phosphatase (EEP) superfamily protein YafD
VRATKPAYRRAAVGLAWLSTIAMFLAWGIVSLLGDRVWWALPFLFGPRWVAGVLLLGALPALVLARRTGLITLLGMCALFFFGLRDLRLGLGRFEPASGTELRVMELNAGAGSAGGPPAETILAEIERLTPDLVIIAECGAGLGEAIAATGGWTVKRSMTSLCLASRFPVESWEERNPMDIWVEGGAGAIARAHVITEGGTLRVGLVQLETPRHALDNYFDLSEIPTLGEVTRRNMRQRERESRTAREWIFAGGNEPTIVVGDFNLPIESAIYKRHWGALRNAFSRSGFGFGETKRTRLWGIRIDHLVTTGDVVTRQAFVGRDVGSDHLPLFARLVVEWP